jgi:prepilin-type N-terminal cleavage/methylation domain-containing protein
MKNKKKSGLSLLELAIAVAIITIAALPILGLYRTSISLNVQGHKITAATFIAQLEMEQLIGLGWSEIESRTTLIAGTTTPATTPDGYVVVLQRHPRVASSSLVHVVVTVFDLDGTSLLCKQENYIYVGP